MEFGVGWLHTAEHVSKGVALAALRVEVELEEHCLHILE